MSSSGFAMPQMAIPSAALAVPYAAPMAAPHEVGVEVGTCEEVVQRNAQEEEKRDLVIMTGTFTRRHFGHIAGSGLCGRTGHAHCHGGAHSAEELGVGRAHHACGRGKRGEGGE
jgi:hypothetical protein